MTTVPPRVLLTGPPGSGKSTAVRTTAGYLHDAGWTVAGFVTIELRVGGQRIGFVAEELSTGARVTLASVDRVEGPRVGRYRVDVAAVDRVMVPALQDAPRRPSTVVVVDEIGRMELTSQRFIPAVEELFDETSAVLATVQLASHPVTDMLKERADVRVVTITPENRDRLPRQLAAIFASAPGRPDPRPASAGPPRQVPRRPL